MQLIQPKLYMHCKLMHEKKKNTYNLLSFGKPLTVSDLITVIWLKERSLQNIKYTIVLNLMILYNNIL